MSKSTNIIKCSCASVYSIVTVMMILQVAWGCLDSRSPLGYSISYIWELNTVIFIYVPFIIFALGSFWFWFATKNVKDAPYFCFGVGLAIIVAKILAISIMEFLWIIMMRRFIDIAAVYAMAFATLFEFGASVYLTSKTLHAADNCDYKPISLRYKIPLAVMYVLMIGWIVFLSYVVKWSCVFYIGYAAMTALSSVMYHRAERKGKWMGKTTVFISILKMIWSAIFAVIFMFASGASLPGMLIPIFGILAFSVASCITEIVAAKRAVKAAAKA